jgi:DNA-binding SARP family transcriptional activator
MMFGILGQLLVNDGTDHRSIPAPKQRIILAALILNANRITSVEDLAALVWEDSRPGSWQAALHNYIARLRRAMGGAGQRLVTHSPGYVLELAPETESDLGIFASLSHRARAAVETRSWQEAGALLRSALEMWRGTPLVDVPCEALHREWVPALTEHRLKLLEWRIESDLWLRQETYLVAELRPLIAAHPLRERFSCQLMIALSRSGRQAEALAVYQDVRHKLVAELGIEPGPELQSTHRRVLAGEPTHESAGDHAS